jgi:hypothetical protein
VAVYKRVRRSLTALLMTDTALNVTAARWDYLSRMYMTATPPGITVTATG